MYTLPVQAFFPPQRVERQFNINRSSLLPLYHGGVPGNSLQDHIDWFNSPVGFEYPQQTRTLNSRTVHPFVLACQLQNECRERTMFIERLITSRCLPAPFRKDVGKKNSMHVTQMDQQLWNYFVSTQQPSTNTTYNRSYTDHGFIRVFPQVNVDKWPTPKIFYTILVLLKSYGIASLVW